jgi:hypothetical protein
MVKVTEQEPETGSGKKKRESETVKKPICFRALAVGTPAAPECSECDCRELCIRTDTMGRPVPKK